MATGLKNNLNLIYNRRLLRKNQTEAEKRLWQQLRAKRFLGLKFFRQYSVGQYILDLYCPEKHLAIELDGGHHAEPDSKQRDGERTIYLEAQGIQVIRFWNNDVMNNMKGVLDVLGSVLNS